METNQITILVNTLADFTREIPPPATLYFNMTERTGHHTYGVGNQAIVIPTKEIHLDLQGLNLTGQIIWLHEFHEFERSPNNDHFWHSRAENTWKQFPYMRQLIADHLATLGYEVRPGQFALPDNLKPIGGIFECIRWTDEGDQLTVELDPKIEVKQ